MWLKYDLRRGICGVFFENRFTFCFLLFAKANNFKRMQYRVSKYGFDPRPWHCANTFSFCIAIRKHCAVCLSTAHCPSHTSRHVQSNFMLSPTCNPFSHHPLSSSCVQMQQYKWTKGPWGVGYPPSQRQNPMPPLPLEIKNNRRITNIVVFDRSGGWALFGDSPGFILPLLELETIAIFYTHTLLPPTNVPSYMEGAKNLEQRRDVYSFSYPP